ncbi:MAG TPA: ZIP family metal transporter [Longimicrobiales bacterium]|nr:ZIP family metal transporter [Longimicrobiales bacterium]
MPALDPILTVLFFSSLAAFTSALGVLPQAVSGRLPLSMLGWGNALAAGLMLGVAYALLAAGLDDQIWQVGGGALLGLAFVRLAHIGTGTEGLDLNRLDEVGPAYGYQVVLVNTLHGAYEGVAIGVAMLVSLPFGISMAVALAVHNIPEAMVLNAILAGRGVRTPHAAGLVVATNANQVLVSVVVFTVAGAMPVLFPWTLGFAAGALIYLLLVELLPESYHQAGRTSIALVALLAMAMVVSLGGNG